MLLRVDVNVVNRATGVSTTRRSDCCQRRRTSPIATSPFVELLLAVGVIGCVGVNCQLRPPKGESPATIISERVLPTGEKEVTVPWDEGFIHTNGQRMAYVDDYPCIKTFRAPLGLIKQERGRCLPKVVFAPQRHTTVDATEQQQVKTLEAQVETDEQRGLYVDYLRKMYNLETQKSASLQEQLDLLNSQLERCELDHL